MTRPSDIPEEIYERADILCDQFRDISDDRELIARVLMEVGQGRQVPRVGLTPMQSSVLTFVDEFQSERGFAPAYHEIAEGVGLASKSGVHRIVHDLVSRGALQLMPGHGRSIAVVGRA
ncbi:LexA family protein [Devosia sp. A369]